MLPLTGTLQKRNGREDSYPFCGAYEKELWYRRRSEMYRKYLWISDETIDQSTRPFTSYRQIILNIKSFSRTRIFSWQI